LLFHGEQIEPIAAAFTTPFFDPAADCERLTDMEGDSKPVAAASVTIRYCTRCQWLLRAAWLAQEALSTFGASLQAVTLEPDAETGGIFVIKVNDRVIWDRSIDGGFPEAKVLKQRIRDHAFPNRDLGHNEPKSPS
jgi:selenoprotein W-related protein